MPVAEKTTIVDIMSPTKSLTRRRSPPHRVVVLAYDGLCTFEFGIVVEMFGLLRPEFDHWYSFSVCGLSQRAVCGMGGITIVPQGGLRELQRADTIIIPGWPKPIVSPPARLVRALVNAHDRGARLVSICVGSFRARGDRTPEWQTRDDALAICRPDGARVSARTNRA